MPFSQRIVNSDGELVDVWQSVMVDKHIGFVDAWLHMSLLSNTAKDLLEKKLAGRCGAGVRGRSYCTTYVDAFVHVHACDVADMCVRLCTHADRVAGGCRVRYLSSHHEPQPPGMVLMVVSLLHAGTSEGA